MSRHRADRPGQPSEQTPRRQFPLYKVVLHYHATQDIMFVVRTVMELTRLCRAEATHKMWEAHHEGRSVVLVTYRERAEFVAERFVDRGLTVSVEPT